MKAVFLALFIVAVTAAPLPEDASGSDAVDMMVNGVPDGAALDLGDVVDIKLKEHGEGGVVVTDLLHPYSAVGIAEAAAAAEAATAVESAAPAESAESVTVAESAVAPAAVESAPPAAPSEAGSVHPMPIVAPPQAIIPEGAVPVVPEPIVLPAPAVPEVVAEQDQLPVPAPQMSSQLYNDGLVQVQYNGPEEPGLLSTLQDWFQVVVNYFTPGSSAPASAGPEPRHHHIH